LADSLTILQTPSFAKAVKKLHPNQKADLDSAVRALAVNPMLGELKKGDLSDIRVHKFIMINQQTLLAYTFIDTQLVLTLLSLGSHENFYRGLK